jgi:hypothetical protein
MHIYGPLERRLRNIESRPHSGRTRVYYIRQNLIVPFSIYRPLYHVALLSIRDDIARSHHLRSKLYMPRTDGNIHIVALPMVSDTPDDIAAYEATLPNTYILGIRDCRHHALDVLNYLYD